MAAGVNPDLLATIERERRELRAACAARKLERQREKHRAGRQRPLNMSPRLRSAMKALLARDLTPERAWQLMEIEALGDPTLYDDETRAWLMSSIRGYWQEAVLSAEASLPRGA